MNIKEIRQLAGWIRDAGLTALEIKRPGFELFIKRGVSPATGQTLAGQDLSEAAPTPAALAGYSVAAANPGVFFSTHPDERNAYITVGDTVAEGQLLGLLKVGRLYLPVRSDKAGRVTQILVGEGERAGYGQPLIEIEGSFNG